MSLDCHPASMMPLIGNRSTVGGAGTEAESERGGGREEEGEIKLETAAARSVPIHRRK